jgi:acyl-CoA thioesterase YciA
MDLSRGVASTSHHIMPDDTNHIGALFGGRAMAWMDLAAGLAAMRLSKHMVVTASIEKVDFQVPIWGGEIAVVEARVESVGRSSMRVKVDMYRESPQTGERTICTSGMFHMVALDEKRRPAQISSP